MYDVHLGFQVLLGFYLLRVSETQVKTAVTWDNARNDCHSSGKIISPHSFALNDVSVFNNRLMMWSSNYYLQCQQTIHTGFCPVLYVEKILGNMSHQGLCYQDSSGKNVMVDAAKTFEKTCNISGHKHSMLRLTSMEDLNEMTSSMKPQKKYWIDGVDIDFRLKGEFVQHCELYRKLSNTTVDKEPYSRSSKSNCHRNYSYMCISGDEYHTAISLISLAEPSNISGVQPTHLGSERNQGESWSQVIGMVTMILMLIGLFIIGCLLKRWIKQMTNQIIEYFRQKYDNRMYENEQHEAQAEAEAVVQPNTPLSPGSSIYDNISNVNIGGTLFRGFDFRENQVARNEIQRVIAVPPASSNVDGRPRLTIPKNTPSRENAVRQKSAGDVIPKPARKPQRKDLTASRTYSSVSCPINPTQECFCESILSQGTPELVSASKLGPESVEIKRKPSPKPNIKFTAPVLKKDLAKQPGQTGFQSGSPRNRVHAKDCSKKSNQQYENIRHN